MVQYPVHLLKVVWDKWSLSGAYFAFMSSDFYGLCAVIAVCLSVIYKEPR